MVETKGQKKFEHNTLVPVAVDPGNNNSIWIDSADSFKLKFRNNAGTSAEIGAGGGAVGSTITKAFGDLNGNTKVTLFSIPAGDVLEFVHVTVTTAFDSGTTFDSVSVENGFSEVSLNTGLVAYWDADNSGAFLDSASTHDGTLNGTTFTSSGILRGARTFNGTTDYIEVADHADFSFTDGAGTDEPFSVSFWANPVDATPASSGFLFCKTNNSTVREWDFRHHPVGYVQVFLWKSDGTARIAGFTAASSLPASTWTQVGFTYDGSETFGGMQMYLNGVPVGMTPDGSGAYTGMSNTAEPVRFGITSAGTFPFEGSLDEIAVWKNVQLTDAQMLSVYNSGKALTHNSRYALEGTLDQTGVVNAESKVGSVLPSETGSTNVVLTGDWSGLTAGEITVKYLINDHV